MKNEGKFKTNDLFNKTKKETYASNHVKHQ